MATVAHLGNNRSHQKRRISTKTNSLNMREHGIAQHIKHYTTYLPQDKTRQEKTREQNRTEQQQIRSELTVEAVLVGDLGHDRRVQAAQKAEKDTLFHARVVLVAAEVLPVDRSPHPRRGRSRVPFRTNTTTKNRTKYIENTKLAFNRPIHRSLRQFT